jgi:hypothetical protein
MLRSILIVALLAAFVTSADCVSAPPVNSTVTAFHVLPAKTAGTTFAFIALEGQVGDLEYQTYQNDMRAHLAAAGWIEADRTTTATLISFAYSIDQGRLATVSMPVFGQTGVSSSSTSGTVDANGNFRSTTTYMPDFGVTGYVPVTRMQYSRVVRISIADRASVDSNATKLVYQASIMSVGSSGVIAPVMPAMLDAVFDDFPGKSGQTRREEGRVR